MKRGITFDIPNEFGRFAADILQPFPISSYTWFIGDGERRILSSKKTPIQTCFRKISASFRVKNSVSVWKETLII
ncbi:hypothetical protein BN2127_JRS5_02428 [Bacillus amyloliquefaciens]|nr:hypothetical protein BN2127_JRS5_02428 [Bacillus amyloliquefaciens]